MILYNYNPTRKNYEKIILATMIACAVAFTACGGDDDNGTSAGGSNASCDVYMGDAGDISGHVCFEYADAEVVKQQCAGQNSQYSAIGGSATSGSGCPSGAKLECPQAGGMVSVYGVLAYGSSCSDFIVKE